MGTDNLALAIGDQNDLARVAESLVTKGDVSGLSAAEKTRYYLATCHSLGLNPQAQPFAFLRLNGKEVMYPTRGATDQLAATHRVNREIIDGPKVFALEGQKILTCTVRATMPGGRSEVSTAAVPLPGTGGEALCNALMKVETKGKRRATLAILGLALLDESELDTIPASEQRPLDHAPIPPQAPASGGAWDEYRASVLEAGTVAEIRTAYLALPTALRLEGRSPEDTVQEAGRLAGDALSRLGLALSGDERRAVLSTASEAALELLDELRAVAQATGVVASWWRLVASALGSDPRSPDRALVWSVAARWAAGLREVDGPGTKRARDALAAAVKALTPQDPPPPRGGLPAPEAPQSTSATAAREPGDDTEDERTAAVNRPVLEGFFERVQDLELPGDAVVVWIRYRNDLAQLSATDRESAWRALCRRAEEVGRMKNARVWLKKAIAEEDERRAQSDPEAPRPTPVPSDEAAAALDWQRTAEGREAHAAGLSHPRAVLASARKHCDLAGYARPLALRLVALTPPMDGAVLSEESALAMVTDAMAQGQRARREAQDAARRAA